MEILFLIYKTTGKKKKPKDKRKKTAPHLRQFSFLEGRLLIEQVFLTKKNDPLCTHIVLPITFSFFFLGASKRYVFAIYFDGAGLHKIPCQIPRFSVDIY